MSQIIKEENMEPSKVARENQSTVITMSGDSSDSNYQDFSSDDSDLDDWGIEGNPRKKQKIEAVLPVGFLDPLTPEERLAIQKEIATPSLSDTYQNGTKKKRSSNAPIVVKQETFEDLGINVSKDKEDLSAPAIRNCKQFWKAGDYEGKNDGDSGSRTVGMDNVRVHPKFLHSNATSHKWALGAFAELLDNALDEVCNGATYVHVDVLNNKKEKNKMLSIQDNGGGMDPDKMRRCMSLGYSAKSKMVNTIGQYGNGFKTSTMRLGADVIVFSRCQGTDGRSTQTIGLLSYTFLRETGKEDIVVPMIDYEKRGEGWNKIIRYTSDDWERNLRVIVQWSPYGSEEELLEQFNSFKDQGTRIIIYNLWEDDQGGPELDFATDKHDIQIRGVSRDERKIEMAKIYPNSRHFLTYQHSLRSYASILYLRLPPGFQMFLRGKEVEHHNIVNDMMQSKEFTYRPAATGMALKDQNMVAVGTIGFVKDAKCHIDVQGFNVYHKNRLIKPFWRVWNAAGSDGRGVIGVLEANFVEPAHDKQGFERTAVLSRLENRLNYIQKNFWSSNCHLIGYAPRRNPKNSVNPASPEKAAPAPTSSTSKSSCKSKPKERGSSNGASVAQAANNKDHRSSAADATENVVASQPEAPTSNHDNTFQISEIPQVEPVSNQIITPSRNVKVEGISRDVYEAYSSTTDLVHGLTEENNSLQKSLDEVLQSLVFERDRNISLQNQLQDTQQQLEKSESERSRLEEDEARLRIRIKDASETIEALLRKVKILDHRGI